MLSATVKFFRARLAATLACALLLFLSIPAKAQRQMESEPRSVQKAISYQFL